MPGGKSPAFVTTFSLYRSSSWIWMRSALLWVCYSPSVGFTEEHVCCHAHTNTHIMQIYWLGPHIYTSHTHAGTVCIAWQLIALFTQRCAASPSTPLSLHPFFFFPSFNTSVAHSYLLPYHRLLPQITVKKESEGSGEKEEQKTLKGGQALAGVSLSLPPTKDQWASISGLSVDTAPRNEQPAGWINTDEK